MITREVAEKLFYREELYHISIKNRDGTPARCRVNGKCKVWKRNPTSFRLPVKYGLKDCFYIDPVNGKDWLTYTQVNELKQPKTIQEALEKAASEGDEVAKLQLHDLLLDKE